MSGRIWRVAAVVVGVGTLAFPALASASVSLSDFRVLSPSDDAARLFVSAPTVQPYGAIFLSLRVLPDTQGCINGGSVVWSGSFTADQLDGLGHATQDITWTRIEGADRHCLYTDTYTNNDDHTGWVLAAEYIFRRPVGEPPPARPTPPADTAAPQTTITRHPKKRLAARRARIRVSFAFRASEAGSSFRCRLDRRAWSTCDSPKRYRVKRGKHVFKVRATDAAGNTDPTPAVWKWIIERP